MDPGSPAGMTGFLPVAHPQQVVGAARRIAHNRHSRESGNPFYPGATSEAFFSTNSAPDDIIMGLYRNRWDKETAAAI